MEHQQQTEEQKISEKKKKAQHRLRNKKKQQEKKRSQKEDHSNEADQDVSAGQAEQVEQTAPPTEAPAPVAGVKRRKSSVDDEQSKPKKPKGDTQVNDSHIPRPPRNRTHGRKRLQVPRAVRKNVPSQNQEESKDKPKEESKEEAKKESKEEPTSEKSNADFRAMFLKK